MWKNVLAGIILENIETLTHYQSFDGDKHALVEDIHHFITNVITGFPWYFRFPVIMLAGMTGILCLLFRGRRLDLLSPDKRSAFLRRVQSLPLFDMLNKLVRSMSFLRLFDLLPPIPGAGSAGIEGDPR